MILSARIDHDYKCLNNYFRKLFDVMQEAIEEDRVTPLKGKILTQPSLKQFITALLIL